VTDDLKAVALTAPEPSGWRHLTRADWERFGRHAGLPAIEYMLRQARADQRRAQRAVSRLEALAAQRAAQVEAGEWPPPVERVTWRELQAGDVLADDPDRDVVVERAEVKRDQHDGEQVTVWYQAPGWGLVSRSAPAGREVAIRPRVDAGKEAGDAEG
jgi:hypothetical protein